MFTADSPSSPPEITGTASLVTYASDARSPFSSLTNEDEQKIITSIVLEKQREKRFKSEKYRSVEASTYHYFIHTPLYYRPENSENYSLFKPKGESITKVKQNSSVFPILYILNTDWDEAYIELKQGIISQIRSHITNNEFEQVKIISVLLLDLMLVEYNKKTIEGLEEVVELLLVESLRSKEMVLNLIPVLEQNLTLGLHSARIMALALKFCIKNSYSMKDATLLCTSSLLHDIGKTMLPTHLVTTNPYNLTQDEDKRAYQVHPHIGYNLLEDCGIKNNVINYGALEHHERIDGSGFPSGKQKISFFGQVIGLLDAYDSLRNGYNQAGVTHSTIEALKIMKKLSEAGKFSKELFQTFVYSLL